MNLNEHRLFTTFSGKTVQRYKNTGGNSGVAFYEAGTDFIKLVFKNNPIVYCYTSARIAKYHIEKMKTLAEMGKGLGTYVSQHPEVRDHYIVRK